MDKLDKQVKTEEKKSSGNVNSTDPIMNIIPNLCAAENSLLLMVDIQPRLTAAMPETEAESMLRCSIRLARSATRLNIPVFFSEQYPKGLGPTEIILTNELPDSSRKFEKTGFSCTAAPAFNQALASTRRKQIILTGQETHVCILQTALELQAFGYQVYVTEDAVCSRSIGHKNWALQRMQQQGMTITNHESVLFEWLKDARHPEFKTISGFLR